MVPKTPYIALKYPFRMFHCVILDLKFSKIFVISVLFSLQNISGVRLTDVFLKRTYDYDDLAQVFVTQATT
jgi:hypothetical protein